MAPQLLFRMEYTAKCDIWSLGLMFYELLYGYPPWPARDLDSYVDGIRRKKLWFPYDRKIGKNSKDFIEKCLVVDEDKRITWEELFEHPLIKNKSQGQQTSTLEIDNETRLALELMQKQSDIKHIDFEEIFHKYSNFQQLDHDKFFQLLKEISPSISSQASKVIFDFADKDNNNKVNLKEFMDLFEKNDFRKADDLQSRYFQQIAALVKKQKLTIDDLFNKIDLNKSGNLDQQEFVQFMDLFSEGVSHDEKMKFFQIFD